MQQALAGAIAFDGDDGLAVDRGEGHQAAVDGSKRVRPCASVRRMATAQAPHSPSAHPSLVPVRPRARSHCRRVTLAPGAPAFTGRPFSTKATAMAKYTGGGRRYNRAQK